MPRAALPPTKQMPGQYEGETMTRRALFTGGALAAGGIATAAILLPAIGFARRPGVRGGEVALAGRRIARRLHPRHLHPEDDDAGRGRRRGRQDDRLRPQGQPEAVPGEKPGRVRRDLDALRAPRLPGALGRSPRERFVCPCHGGVYDFEGKVVGGPPVRPLDRFETRVRERPGPDRPALQRQLAAEARSRRATRASTLDGLWQYLYPKRFTVPSP